MPQCALREDDSRRQWQASFALQLTESRIKWPGPEVAIDAAMADIAVGVEALAILVGTDRVAMMLLGMAERFAKRALDEIAAP